MQAGRVLLPRLMPCRMLTQQAGRKAKAGRAGVRQAAVDAVIDVERVAATALHLDDDRGAASDQRAAWLGPQRHLNRQAERLDGGVDLGEVGAKRRRLAVGIADREAAADIEHLDRDAGGADHRAGERDGASIGERVEALRTDVERHAEPGGMRTRGTQQRHRLVGLGAELAGQVVFRLAARQGKPEDQAEIVRMAGLIEDLCQLAVAVEHEVAHAVARVSGAYRRARLHRVHEVYVRVGEHRAHQAHLVGRGAVEMPHAAVPHRAQHGRHRVAFHGIQRLAGEPAAEAPCDVGDRRRSDAMHRLARALDAHEVVDARQHSGGLERAPVRRAGGAGAEVAHGGQTLTINRPRAAACGRCRHHAGEA